MHRFSAARRGTGVVVVVLVPHRQIRDSFTESRYNGTARAKHGDMTGQYHASILKASNGKEDRKSRIDNQDNQDNLPACHSPITTRNSVAN